MPQGPRIDLPEVLQHVIVRGLQRQRIFRDEEDREAFRSRPSALLVGTRTECLPWALLPDRFQLPLRPRDVPLASFNLRHRRSGHLFLGIGQAGVSRAAVRGDEDLRNHQGLRERGLEAGRGPG